MRAGRRDRGGRRPDRDVDALRPGQRAESWSARPTSRSSCPPGRSSCRARARLAAASPSEHGLAVATALIVKYRDAGTARARRARECAPVSVALPNRRRARPADLALDLAGFDLGGARRAPRHAVLPVRPRRRRAARRRASGGPARAVPPRLRGQGEPARRAVLERMASLGLGADVASGGELERVLAAGFDADRVVFTGPGKRDAELATAVAAGRRADHGRVAGRAAQARP